MKLSLKFKPMKLPVKYDRLSHVKKRLVREEYVRIQNGLCWHCEEPLDGKPSKKVIKSCHYISKSLFPENFFKYPVHLHHSHVTGLTIGATHCECNAVLWHYHGE